MAKITMTNLIKYCRRMSEADANPEEDWTVQRRRYKVIAEQLEAFDTMNKRDDKTTAVKVVKIGTGTYEGTCIKCKMQISSRFDFCPRCGRPIEWEEAKKNARKI